jgi:transposase
MAKNIFQVHGITEDEEVAFNRPLRRAQLLPFFSKLEPCLIGMEACSSAHHWARELTALGHDVRLIPPIYVKPYVKRGKSDAIDAEAICEAVTRPTMRFVGIKTVEQQALLSLHRARSLLVRQRTQLINGLRGMVAEFGVYIARGLARVIGFAEDILMGEVLDLPEIANEVIHNLCEHLMALHLRLRWYEDRLKYRRIGHLGHAVFCNQLHRTCGGHPGRASCLPRTILGRLQIRVFSAQIQHNFLCCTFRAYPSEHFPASIQPCGGGAPET